MVGCGQIAEAHLKAIAALDSAVLTFAVDIAEESARSAAERYGAPSWSTDYADALSSSDVDAVVLCLPHDLHKSFTIQAAHAGKQVLLEKPMALDEAEAREMVEAVEEHGIQLSVGQSTRCVPSFQKAKQLLDAGQIGKVVNVSHQRFFWIEQLSTDWRRDLDACGGLYLSIFGSHDIDALLWLLDTEPERIWASVRATSHVSGGDSDGFVGLDLAGGAVASLAFSARTHYTRDAALYIGTDGHLLVTRRSVELNGEEVDLDQKEGTFTLQMRLFVEALLADRQVPVSGREVLKTVRTLDLARRASESGQTQTF
jgi:predicted dehydrogenase